MQPRKPKQLRLVTKRFWDRNRFDAPAPSPLRFQDRIIEGGMNWSGEEPQEQQAPPSALPPFPRIWIGYLLGVATLITEMIAITLHPELAKEPLLIPPLYLFLANFISLVYWMVCVYEFHLVLMQASGGTYPIKPVRAAWFHLIPIYGLYWVYKWPRQMAYFVNSRLPAPLMRPDRTGLAVFMAFVVFLILDRGFGMILLFWAAAHLSRWLRYALAAQPSSSAGPLPFS
jgi:hypothetical protein